MKVFMHKLLSFSVVLFLLFLNSFSFCMDQPLELFTCFNDLIPVIQDKTFACSQPQDKNRWQKTNKDWNKRGSINVPAVYKTAFHDPFYMAEKDKIRILLSACYNKQYHIVQN